MKKLLIFIMMFLIVSLLGARDVPRFTVGGGLGYIMINDGDAYKDIYGTSSALFINGNASIRLSEWDRGEKGLYVTGDWSKYGDTGTTLYDSYDAEIAIITSNYGGRYAWIMNRAVVWVGGGYESISYQEVAGSFNLETNGTGWFIEYGGLFYHGVNTYSSFVLRYGTATAETEGGTSEGNFDGGGFSILYNFGVAIK